MKYRAEIDGLRAVAVVPVILFHAGIEFFSGGFVGVDVFFVISGFLITSIILSDLERNTFSILTFYERRARRILPALTFVILCCLPFAWILLSPSDLVDFAHSILATATFTSNILFWLETDYFAAASELKPLLHTWSLAIEEQYYIFFPVFMVITWRFGLKAIISMLLAMTLLSLTIAQWGSWHKPAASYFLLPTRAFELLIGSITAIFLSRDLLPKVSKTTENLVSIIGLALIIYAILAFDKNTVFPGASALVPTIGTAFILIFAQTRTIIQRVLSQRAFVAVGLISYSAYLWHQPLFAFFRYQSTQHPSLPIMISLAFISFGLAYISWRFVETPFRSKDGFNQRQILKLSVGCIAALAAIGFIGSISSGYSERFTQNQLAYFATTQSSPLRSQCHTRGDDYLPPSKACRYTSGTQTWAILGDSHATELAFQLGQDLAGQNDGILQLSFSACAPTYGQALDTACARWTNDAIEEILSDQIIENVVISYRLAGHLFGNHTLHYPGHKDEFDDAHREQIWLALSETVEVLRLGGKRVFLILQAPELPADIERLIISDNAKGISNELPGATYHWWEKRQSYVTERLGEFHEDIYIIDPKNEFCDKKMCYASRNSQSLYFDDHHISLAGAKIISDLIFRTVHAAP